MPHQLAQVDAVIDVRPRFEIFRAHSAEIENGKDEEKRNAHSGSLAMKSRSRLPRRSSDGPASSANMVHLGGVRRREALTDYGAGVSASLAACSCIVLTRADWVCLFRGASWSHTDNCSS